MGQSHYLFFLSIGDKDMNITTLIIALACIFLFGYKLGLEAKTAPLDINDAVVTKVRVSTLPSGEPK